MHFCVLVINCWIVFDDLWHAVSGVNIPPAESTGGKWCSFNCYNTVFLSVHFVAIVDASAALSTMYVYVYMFLAQCPENTDLHLTIIQC